MLKCKKRFTLLNSHKANLTGVTLLEINRAKKKNRKNKSLTGFTIIELIVAITVFVLVISAASGIFILALRHQARALDRQELLSQASFLKEYMSRGIRMAKKQRGPGHHHPACIPLGLNFETNPPDNNSIKFIKWDALEEIFICYQFFLDGTILRVSRDGGVTSFPLTSAELAVVNLRFHIIGDGVEGAPHLQLQPRITIALEIKGRGAIPAERPKIYLQTTVSQRDLDI